MTGPKMIVSVVMLELERKNGFSDWWNSVAPPIQEKIEDDLLRVVRELLGARKDALVAEVQRLQGELQDAYLWCPDGVVERLRAEAKARRAGGAL